MKMLKSVVLFLALNFLTLYIGVSLYGEGGTSNWYANLNRAPWEPPGWVFGIAWFVLFIINIPSYFYALQSLNLLKQHEVQNHIHITCDI